MASPWVRGRAADLSILDEYPHLRYRSKSPRLVSQVRLLELLASYTGLGIFPIDCGRRSWTRRQQRQQVRLVAHAGDAADDLACRHVHHPQHAAARRAARGAGDRGVASVGRDDDAARTRRPAARGVERMRAVSAPSSPASAFFTSTKERLLLRKLLTMSVRAVRREGEAEGSRRRRRIVGADEHARDFGVLRGGRRFLDVEDRYRVAFDTGARAFAIRGRDQRTVRADRDAPRARPRPGCARSPRRDRRRARGAGRSPRRRRCRRSQ